ncbi:hypothetical protein [Micromonospora antibiotica]|uniref:Uncharacterized protein n=1 Tax=Micromonospora antibiotica TaxID=2807623 RepID=A0ABS3V201_9ACTN|nr:hypothetical protein [Micromonospora antibiotica]MBO4159646.1 hypothetical protein [Micromonospora antibiotica]
MILDREEPLIRPARPRAGGPGSAALIRSVRLIRRLGPGAVAQRRA